MSFSKYYLFNLKLKGLEKDRSTIAPQRAKEKSLKERAQIIQHDNNGF